MSIELTREQSEALATEALPDDDPPWTPAETAALAAAAFGKLDDTDYDHYLRNTP